MAIPQTNLFIPSPLFTFNWYDNDAETPYNTDPIDDLDIDVNYAQPMQCGGDGYQVDTGVIQIVSDFVPTCGLYRCDNSFVKSVPLIAIDPPILNVSFICYNGLVDFSDVDPGLYYLKTTYTDENETERDWRTYGIDVQIYHDGTQLFEATNTKNDKGAVFVKSDGTLLNSTYRVASWLHLPVVKSDAQDYEDQYNDLTQETSIPYITLTQVLGGPLLLPFWVIEKINLLYSLNQVNIDGKPFAKISGQDFRPTRSDIGNNGAWWEVDIQPNTSYPSDVFVTGDPAEGDYIVIKQARTFKNKSADFAYTGNFTAGKNLIRIAVVNNGSDVFVMTIGTTEGGSELGSISFPDDNTDSIDIGKLFKVPTDIYIGGIDGTNLDITFDWNDYLAKNVIPGQTGQLFAKNTIYYFMEIVPDSFETEFDVASGLGNVGTDHEGCVLAGTNGTPAVDGMVVRGWDRTLPLTRQTSIGSDEVTIPRGSLPAIGLKSVNGDSVNTSNPLAPGGGYIPQQHNQGNNRDYALQQSGTAPDRGPTENMGDGDPLIVTPFSIILPAFYYIGT